jgi:hypothetical protein
LRQLRPSLAATSSPLVVLALLGDSLGASHALPLLSASLGGTTCACFRLRRPPTASETLRAAAVAEAFCVRHAMTRRRCRTATASTEAVSTSGARGISGNCHRQLSYLLTFRLEKNRRTRGTSGGPFSYCHLREDARCSHDFGVGRGRPWASTVAIT